MHTWLAPALLSLISFGLWGLFTKLTILYVNSKNALVFQTVGVMLIGFIVLGQLNFKPTGDFKGIFFGLLTGIAYGLGCFFYFIAADKGKVSTIVTLTALYPFITLLLSFLFLKETVSAKQYIGIILAMGAIYLMSS